MGRRCAHGPAGWIAASTNASLTLKSTGLQWFSPSRRRFGLPLLRGCAEVIRVDCDLVSLRVDMAFSAGTDDVSTDRCRGEAVSSDAQLGP